MENEGGRTRDGDAGGALEWVIRGCACLSGAEGEAARVLREAYGRGLCGLGENRREYELYVGSRIAEAGEASSSALRRLILLRSEAYRLGRRDQALIGMAALPGKEMDIS